MIFRHSKRIAMATAAVLALGLALQAPAALAQTATNVICNGCVQGTDIANGTIGPNKLIPGSVNATIIANQSIGPNKLIPGSINTATIANNSIRSNKIIDGAVKTVDIADDAITANKILDGAVGTSEVAGLLDVDIADEPGIEFLNDSGFPSDISVVPTNWTVMRSLTVTMPDSGYVSCTAAGHADWEGANLQSNLELGWDLSTANVAPDSYNFVGANSGADSDLRLPIMAMHTYFFATAGTVVFHLKSRCTACIVNQVDFSFHGANCLYVPTRY